MQPKRRRRQRPVLHELARLARLVPSGTGWRRLASAYLMRVASRFQLAWPARWYVLSALLTVVTWAVGSEAFDRYRVASASMEPALHCAGRLHCRAMHAESVVISRWSYHVGPVRRGDIVAIRGNGKYCGSEGVLIKRVVALPGDEVLVKDKRVTVSPSINGNHSPTSHAMRDRAHLVPRSHYFVLGDNRQYSCDSRDFGPITESSIQGKVVLVLSSGMVPRRPA